MRHLAWVVIFAFALGFAPAPVGTESSQRTIVFSSYRVTEDGLSRYVADLFLLRGNTVVRRLSRGDFFENDAAWSPDGQRLAFSKSEPLCHAGSCDEPIAGGIWIRSLQAPRARRITAGAEDCLDRSPSWSADGGTIAFARVYCEDSGIYTVRPDGSTEERVIGGEMSALDWAPSGEVIAFVRENGGVGLVDVSTSEVTALRFPTVPRGRMDVDWSPSGRLAFATGAGIYVGSSRGGRARRLVRTAYADGVSWSPDGARLAFSAVLGPRGTRSDVFTVRVNGRGLQRLTKNPGPDFDPAWRP